MPPTLQSRPPLVVTLAVLAFVFSYLASDIWHMSVNWVPPRVTQVLALALVWLPVALIANATYRGRFWGRWLVLGLTAFGLGYLPWSLPAAVKPSTQALQVLQAMLHLLASVLLLLPSARLWFAKPNRHSAIASAEQHHVA